MCVKKGGLSAEGHARRCTQVDYLIRTHATQQNAIKQQDKRDKFHFVERKEKRKKKKVLKAEGVVMCSGEREN